ncbi:hypothetical protein C7C46_21495 [Streptomyces tateyamensis]|uniref:Uncharacterized protein n=1 Tax=Streptomyces tateyamensis TaxID=565073 RepID=A0A2V4NLQ3_9ACTN|nr:hypothetical protein [Streptomyces tateyamensis]PYC76761.1 hypothetical protein C7C46_21495 [Streptomyces tateyamensis]
MDLTEPGYYKALKSKVRTFSAAPALFYAASSFLVLGSASVAASGARPARRRSSGSATRSEVS